MNVGIGVLVGLGVLVGCRVYSGPTMAPTYVTVGPAGDGTIPSEVADIPVGTLVAGDTDCSVASSEAEAVGSCGVGVMYTGMGVCGTQAKVASRTRTINSEG